MFRMVRKPFLAVLIAASALLGPHSLRAQGAQRRPVRPSSSTSALDSLGLSQPESVRAILLLYLRKSHIEIQSR